MEPSAVIQPLLSLLFLLFLPCPSMLYSLQNCTIGSTDPWNISCKGLSTLSRIPPDLPTPPVFLSVQDSNLKLIQQNDFCGFTELQTLDLSRNQISHIEDAAFSHLPSLAKLALIENRLSNLTDHTFTGLSNLTELNLSLNQITSISLYAFAPLTNLQILDLSDNLLSSIKKILNISFSVMLKTIHLSGNPLTSFDAEYIPNPLNITELLLNDTPLSRFTLHSDKLPHLQILSLSTINTQLKWDISDKSFLRSLRTLNLNRTNFSVETYQSIFQSLNSLKNLDLSSVKLFDKGLLGWACEIQTLQQIDLCCNKISVLKDPLLPCSNLTVLNLSQNSMSRLSPASLQMLTRLSWLSLQLNSLTLVPRAIRNMSSLTFLSLNSNYIRKLRCLDFTGLRLLNILDLRNNTIKELDNCVFEDLQGLQKLYIQQNRFLNLEDRLGSFLPNMLVLHAGINYIVKLQKGLFGNMTRLTDLDLRSIGTGVRVERGAFDGLMELRTFIISLVELIGPTSVSLGPQSSSKGHSELQQVFNLPSLQIFNLIFSDFYCLSSTKQLFQGLNDLTVLTFKASFAPDSKPFNYMPNLLHLEIVNYNGWLPAPELFQPLPALQTLDLSENHLKSPNFLFDANLTQLQTLLLQKNDLSVIDVGIFDALPSLRYLDLSENAFACDCSNMDFILWAINNKRVYVNEAFQYKCAYPSSGLLLEFNLLWCWESGFPCFLLTFALVLFTIISSFLHKFFRFHLMYGFYLLRAALFHRQKMKQGYEEIYDAFVSYSVHDEEWVYNELVPELEERQGWKLCLHHRDFMPGKAILENITDAIYSSRKTLCVISHEYLLSDWCSREIQMASYRLLDEQKDVLVLLLLEELSSNQLSPFFRMRKLMRSRTYLSWTGARGHRGLFWERVRRALESGAQFPADNPLPADV